MTIAVSLLVCAILLCGCLAVDFSAFYGTWGGVADTTPLGPMLSTQPFQWRVLPTNSSDTFVITDLFTSNVSTNSSQFFYVQGTYMLYCGMVLDFFGNSSSIGGAIRVPFTLQPESNSTYIRFCDLVAGCQFATWWLKLLSPDVMEIKTHIYPPAVHTHIMLKRTSSVATPFQLPFSGSLQNYTCRPYQGQRHGASMNRPVESLASRGGGCPLRFSSNHARPSHRKVPAGPIVGPFCYQLNDAMEYRLQWSVDLGAQTLTANVSVNGVAGDWIGLGFNPDFPGMNGSDVVLGFQTSTGESCVQSLYASDYVGPPLSDNATLQLSDTAASFANGRVSVSFTRPLNGGHNPLPLQQLPFPAGSPFLIMYATGKGPNSDCSSMPAYHKNTRGFSNINWAVPSMVLDDNRRC